MINLAACASALLAKRPQCERGGLLAPERQRPGGVERRCHVRGECLDVVALDRPRRPAGGAYGAHAGAQVWEQALCLRAYNSCYEIRDPALGSHVANVQRYRLGIQSATSMLLLSGVPAHNAASRAVLRTSIEFRWGNLATQRRES